MSFIRCFFFLFLLNVAFSEDDIVVIKNKVMHVFIPFDEKTDRFVKDTFVNWENDTFDVFDQVKDPDGIAVDLGAWIGTTSIWLSNYFHHVLAVEADSQSLQCLMNNLNASGCTNVSICKQPISDLSANVVFGPLGELNLLNESTSQIKLCPNNERDSFIRSITLKQLLFDYVYTNPDLKNKKISFFKCDIEGGEENILEDLLYFAFHNKSKALISFHYSWWKSKKIEDFAYLFKNFKTNCLASDLCAYIEENPFVSILFEPLETDEPILKKNIPAFIIAYNQPTYIKQMVSQLEKYTTDIIVIDNASSFPPLLDYYANEYQYSLLRQKENFGHTVYCLDFVQKLAGDVFILTDPDLKFNPRLPDDFIKTLFEISNCFCAEKVGFALNIHAADLREDIYLMGKIALVDWESAFWKHRLYYPFAPEIELYKAGIDTTFALINKKSAQRSLGASLNQNVKHIRVGGDFTCSHLPWHKNFDHAFMEGEYDFMQQNNKSSNYIQKNKESEDQDFFFRFIEAQEKVR